MYVVHLFIYTYLIKQKIFISKQTTQSHIIFILYNKKIFNKNLLDYNFPVKIHQYE